MWESALRDWGTSVLGLSAKMTICIYAHLCFEALLMLVLGQEVIWPLPRPCSDLSCMGPGQLQAPAWIWAVRNKTSLTKPSGVRMGQMTDPPAV